MRRTKKTCCSSPCSSDPRAGPSCFPNPKPCKPREEPQKRCKGKHAWRTSWDQPTSETTTKSMDAKEKLRHGSRVEKKWMDLAKAGWTKQMQTNVGTRTKTKRKGTPLQRKEPAPARSERPVDGTRPEKTAKAMHGTAMDPPRQKTTAKGTDPMQSKESGNAMERVENVDTEYKVLSKEMRRPEEEETEDTSGGNDTDGWHNGCTMVKNR
mmetsp:Transcript_5960/g.36969  ORF Transcript_5960/g.36969 Transcript_5960/m.36969 type:complete len:210 (-) Transcript_5960:5827-6456(-)